MASPHIAEYVVVTFERHEEFQPGLNAYLKQGYMLHSWNAVPGRGLVAVLFRVG